MHSIVLYRFFEPGFGSTGKLPRERFFVHLFKLLPLLEEVFLFLLVSSLIISFLIRSGGKNATFQQLSIDCLDGGLKRYDVRI